MRAAVRPPRSQAREVAVAGTGMDPEHAELEGAAQGELCCRSISCGPFRACPASLAVGGARVWSDTIACTGLCLPGMGQYGYFAHQGYTRFLISGTPYTRRCQRML